MNGSLLLLQYEYAYEGYCLKGFSLYGAYFYLYTRGKERQDLMFQFKGLLAVTDEPGNEGILMCSQSFQKSAVPNVALAEK